MYSPSAKRATVAGGLLCLLALFIQILAGTAWAQTAANGICGRTPQVQTAILEWIGGVSDCGAVTEEQLAAITGLGFWGAGISNLRADDFAGLSSLQLLDLRHNALETLPAGVFSGLGSLEFLWLADFAGLSSLQLLDLRHNALETLPAGVFSGLGSHSSGWPTTLSRHCRPVCSRMRRR